MIKKLLILLLLPSICSAALVFHSGFETNDFSEFQSTTGSPAVVSTHPNTGTYEMQCDTTGGAATSFAVPLGTTRRFTFYLYIATAPNVECTIIGSDGFGAVRLKTDRYIVLKDGAVIEGTSTTQLSTGTWYRISVSPDTSNNCKVYINGTEEITTAAMANAISRSFGIRTSATADLFFDDYAGDNTDSTADLGDIRTQVALPVGNGNQNDYDQTSGFGLCDNLPDDSDFVEDDGADVARELFDLTTMTTMGVSGDTPEAINIIYRMDRDGGGGTDHGITARDNGTNNETLNAGTAAWTQYSKYYATLPTGGGAWTEARFDALEVGPYHLGAQNQRCSTVNVMLAYSPAAAPPAAEGQVMIIMRD